MSKVYFILCFGALGENKGHYGKCENRKYHRAKHCCSSIQVFRLRYVHFRVVSVLLLFCYVTVLGNIFLFPIPYTRSIFFYLGSFTYIRDCKKGLWKRLYSISAEGRQTSVPLLSRCVNYRIRATRMPSLVLNNNRPNFPVDLLYSH